MNNPNQWKILKQNYENLLIYKFPKIILQTYIEREAETLNFFFSQLHTFLHWITRKLYHLE